MSFDYGRSRSKADFMIRKYGQASKLVRDGTPRDCWALEVQLSASDKRALKNEKNRVFLVSAVDLAVPPGKPDSLLWNDPSGQVELRQDAPVSPFAPGGVIIYYELQVQG